MVQASTYSRALLLTCTAGIALCAYAFIVEEKKSHDAKYQAACDLGENMSCSRVLTSPYAKGFGVIRHLLGEDSPLNVPNTIPGGAMYALLAVLSLIQRPWTAKIQVGVGFLSIAASAYLAFILYFVLQDFCVLCVSTYALNVANLLLAFLRLRALTPAGGKQSGKQKGGQKSQKKQQQQQQNNDKPKSPKADKQKQQQKQQQQQQQKKQQQQSEKQKSPQADKQKNSQQNGKVKNQHNDKQKSPKTPNSKKKN